MTRNMVAAGDLQDGKDGEDEIIEAKQQNGRNG